MEDQERLLTVREVAALARVKEKTVRIWARAGKLPVVRTPGHHLRFAESEIRALLDLPDDASPGPSSTPPAGRGHD